MVCVRARGLQPTRDLGDRGVCSGGEGPAKDREARRRAGKGRDGRVCVGRCECEGGKERASEGAMRRESRPPETATRRDEGGGCC